MKIKIKGKGNVSDRVLKEIVSTAGVSVDVELAELIKDVVGDAYSDAMNGGIGIEFSRTVGYRQVTVIMHNVNEWTVNAFVQFL